MNHFTTSVLLLVAGLSATSAFAQSGPAPETSVVTARFAPAAPAEEEEENASGHAGRLAS